MLDPNLKYKGVRIPFKGPQIFFLPRSFSPVSGYAYQRRGSGAGSMSQSNPSVYDLNYFLKNARKAKTRKTKLFSLHLPNYHLKFYQSLKVIPQTFKIHVNTNAEWYLGEKK